GRGEGGLLGTQVEELRLGPLLRLPHRGLLRGDQAGDPRAGIVEITGHNGLHGADDHAGGLEADLDAMRAVVALGRRLCLGVDVERVVRTGLRARLAADAAISVEVHDAVGAPVESDGGADGDTGGVVAVVAAHHGEVAPRVGEGAFLDVLDPRAVDPEGNLILLLAGDGARVAADAFALIDHEAVAHGGHAISESVSCSALASPGHPRLSSNGVFLTNR